MISDQLKDTLVEQIVKELIGQVEKIHLSLNAVERELSEKSKGVATPEELQQALEKLKKIEGNLRELHQMVQDQWRELNKKVDKSEDSEKGGSQVQVFAAANEEKGAERLSRMERSIADLDRRLRSLSESIAPLVEESGTNSHSLIPSTGVFTDNPEKDELLKRGSDEESLL